MAKRADFRYTTFPTHHAENPSESARLLDESKTSYPSKPVPKPLKLAIPTAHKKATTASAARGHKSNALPVPTKAALDRHSHRLVVTDADLWDMFTGSTISYDQGTGASAIIYKQAAPKDNEPSLLRVVKHFPMTGARDRQPLRGLIKPMHKNIVPMLHIFSSESGLHVVYELVQGASLHEMLQMPGNPWTSASDSSLVLEFEDEIMQAPREDFRQRARISSIMQQLLSALEYLHSRHKIQHGQICAKNVLISLGGLVRLAAVHVGVIASNHEYKSDMQDLASLMLLISCPHRSTPTPTDLDREAETFHLALLSKTASEALREKWLTSADACSLTPVVHRTMYTVFRPFETFDLRQWHKTCKEAQEMAERDAAAV